MTSETSAPSAGPIPIGLRSLQPTQRNRLTAAFRDAIEPHTEATGVHFDTPYAVVSATRR